MKVYAPNKGYTGVSASVSFCNGVGETDNPHLLKWFRNHGYKVEEKPEAEKTAEPPEAPEGKDIPEEVAEKEDVVAKKSSKKV